MSRAIAAAIWPFVAPLEFHSLPDGRRIAFRHARGHGLTIVFLPGYMSDMAGAKATAVAEWAKATGRASLLLDYSGCGESPGEFADGTLSRWRDEIIDLLTARVEQPVVLVGSSMGGWLMLLVAEAIRAHVAALVGIAAAPDFTDWGYDDEERRRLASGATVRRENPYGPEATPTHAEFWRDGQGMRRLGNTIAFTGPVRLLHGTADAEVPPDLSLRLAGALRSEDVQITLVKGGDHRLSRPQDLALLGRTLAELCETIPL